MFMVNGQVKLQILVQLVSIVKFESINFVLKCHRISELII